MNIYRLVKDGNVVAIGTSGTLKKYLNCSDATVIYHCHKMTPINGCMVFLETNNLGNNEEEKAKRKLTVEMIRIFRDSLKDKIGAPVMTWEYVMIENKPKKDHIKKGVLESLNPYIFTVKYDNGQRESFQYQDLYKEDCVKLVG